MLQQTRQCQQPDDEGRDSNDARHVNDEIQFVSGLALQPEAESVAPRQLALVPAPVRAAYGEEPFVISLGCAQRLAVLPLPRLTSHDVDVRREMLLRLGMVALIEDIPIAGLPMMFARDAELDGVHGFLRKMTSVYHDGRPVSIQLLALLHE